MTASVLAFGAYRLDVHARVLERDGQAVGLQPKAVDLLIALTAGAGRVLTKRELLDAVWPGAFVEEGNLSKLVFLIRRELGSRPDGGEWIETVPTRGYRFVGAGAAGRSSPSPDRVIVLPFTDLSSTADQTAFCEGLSEEIMNALARVPDLLVLGRGTAQALRGRPDATLAAQLGVGMIVEGAVRRERERLRVTARIVDAASGSLRHSSTIEGSTAEIFAVQARVAATLAESLTSLSATGVPRAATPAASTSTEDRPPHMYAPTRDLEAWDLVLQARYLWNRRPGPAALQALEIYERAVARDPGFALAWAGMADVYGTLGSWESGVLPHGEAQAKAREAAARALALDPQLAAAHATLAYAAMHHDCDLGAAERGFRHALSLEPRNAAARHWLAHQLIAAGREDEALDESRAALDCDPLNPILHVHMAWHHHMARHPALVVEQAERVMRLEPHFHWAHFFHGWGLEAVGLASEAVEAHRRAVTLSSDAPVMLAGLARACAVAGDHAEARRLAAALRAHDPTGQLFAYEHALIALALGERDTALQQLEHAADTRSGWMAYLTVDPRLDALRQAPQFAAILARRGVPSSVSPAARSE